MKYDGSYTGDVSKFDQQSDRAAELIKKWQYLFGLRGNWNTQWQEIAQRILPMDSYLFNNFSQLSSQGDKRNFELYDSTGLQALRTFGSIMDSLLTPRDQIYQHLRPADNVLLKDRATMLWFEEANKILFARRYASTSNFAAQNQGQYISLGAYGTGINFIDALETGKGLRYKNVHLGEVYMQENHQGLIDQVCRHFVLTARQAYQKFGDSCPEQITSTMDIFPEGTFYFLHWIMPNDKRDPQRLDYKGMEYSSVYISIEGQSIVKESGYRCFPFAISRYYQAANETYGRSIAMDVLPTLKTLNEQYKTMLKMGHRAADPVFLVHDDGVIDGFSLEPGSMNSGGVSEDGKLLVQAIPSGNFQVQEKVMDDNRQVIKDAFLINLFQILTQNPQQTATEVLERTREKGILMAPTIGRQNSEYLGPMTYREIDILESQGLLPKKPRLLESAKGQYKIEFDSPITRTAKAEYGAGAQRTLEMMGQYAQMTQDPTIMDIIDADVAFPEIALNNGTPISWIRDPKDIARIRQQRNKQVQQQQQVQAAPAAAAMMKAKMGQQ